MKQDVIIIVVRKFDSPFEWADVSVINMNGEIIEQKKLVEVDVIDREWFNEYNDDWDNIPSFEQRKEMLRRGSRSSIDEIISRKNKLLCLIARNHFQDKYNIINIISV